MYELFILGKLMHRPMHGYLLQSIINKALAPFRRLSWGTLYPLLRELEQSGLIAIEAEKLTDRRGTKKYRTTQRGRSRFLELMRSDSDLDGQYRDLFRIKLSNFGHIGKDDRRSILTEYRALLAAIVEHSEAMSSEVLQAPGLAPAERPHVLDAIDHHRHLAASEIEWVDSLIQRTGGNHAKRAGKKRFAISRPDRNRHNRTGPRSRSAPRQ
jgi:DNA-binding PadR family transcriptional regulator